MSILEVYLDLARLKHRHYTEPSCLVVSVAFILEVFYVEFGDIKNHDVVNAAESFC